jgi:Zn-finger nucleic acid-binding protein
MKKLILFEMFSAKYNHFDYCDALNELFFDNMEYDAIMEIINFVNQKFFFKDTMYAVLDKSENSLYDQKNIYIEKLKTKFKDNYSLEFDLADGSTLYTQTVYDEELNFKGCLVFDDKNTILVFNDAPTFLKNTSV